jgi:hypothetical protein
MLVVTGKCFDRMELKTYLKKDKKCGLNILQKTPGCPLNQLFLLSPDLGFGMKPVG